MNWTPILGVIVAAVIVGVVIWVAYQSLSSSGGGDPGWLKAELDSSPSIPGEYIKPNPGPDGKFGTDDDRQHLASTVTVPICSADAMALDAAIADVYADRKDVANCYNSNPPTSGPHDASPMPFKVLDNPARKENLLHNMEHGGIVIWYNTSDQAVIKELADLTNRNLDQRKLVVMSQYTDMESDTVAVTSWTRLLKFKANEVDTKQIQNFINKNEKRFNPEGF